VLAQRQVRRALQEQLPQLLVLLQLLWLQQVLPHQQA
jgi:hypothetical protein